MRVTMPHATLMWLLSVRCEHPSIYLSGPRRRAPHPYEIPTSIAYRCLCSRLGRQSTYSPTTSTCPPSVCEDYEV
ncbi:hypothetical protein F5Y14DRAFT_101387 [Nemania sp. NC0429]|nr:hypothetical protein F5Y14DRAFT_101387 [Nemania sp. NC0429]